MGEASHRILIVEDEQTLRTSMVRGLSRLPGVTAVDASTVREAKRLLHKAPPGLLISDLDLPDGSGIEVAAELEQLGIRIPVLFISAFVGKFQHRLPRGGDVEVHEKPVALDRLRALVEEKLGLASDEAPLSPFGVSDYVQLAAMGRHTVVIEVRGMAGDGRVIIKGGALWSAVDTLGVGMDAFRRLVFLKAAQVTCRTLDRDEVPARNIRGSAEAMLLEVARTYDEGARESQLPQEKVDDGWGDLLEEEQAAPKSSRLGRPRSYPPLARADASPPAAKAKSIPPAARTKTIPPAPRPKTVPPPRGRPSSIPPVSKPAPRFARPVAPDLPAATRRSSGERFEQAFERGVDALLRKDYKAALAAFEDADLLAPGDRRVQANLKRLHDMGYS